MGCHIFRSHPAPYPRNHLVSLYSLMQKRGQEPEPSSLWATTQAFSAGATGQRLQGICPIFLIHPLAISTTSETISSCLLCATLVQSNINHNFGPPKAYTLAGEARVTPRSTHKGRRTSEQGFRTSQLQH